MLESWGAWGATIAGTNGAMLLLLRWRWERRKMGADTAAVFTEMAKTLATEAREAATQAQQAAQREHDENERLRAEVRQLRAEVAELRLRIAQMQQDVSATRSAVERSAAEELWVLPETTEPGADS